VVGGTGLSPAGGTGARTADRGLPPRVGVLAVQGAFAAHRAVLVRLRAEVVEVRTPADLEGVEALVLPGGESTTISMLLGFNGLTEPLRETVVNRGMPALGTCAGMIVLARTILDGRDDQVALEAVDISVRRNAFGRQVDSFETDLEVEDLAGGPFPAVFIRAPVVEGVGQGVEVLATVDGRPVLCRQGAVLVAAFHPELSGDDRIHRLLLDEVARRRAQDHASHRQLGCQNRPAHPAGGSGPIAR
jgi:pyridoxal 5'-phosphate synthase pdxT subunit